MARKVACEVGNLGQRQATWGPGSRAKGLLAKFSPQGPGGEETGQLWEGSLEVGRLKSEFL